MEDLRAGFAQYRKEVYPLQREALAQLASEGQKPTTLIIGCSDSRVKITELVQAGPGRLFIVRNAGNVVPRWDTFRGGVAASIEFAVTQLPISELVICGHSSCGFIDALLYPEKVSHLPAFREWVRLAASASEKARMRAKAANSDDLPGLTARENVLLQLEHLRQFPCVQEREGKGLRLHGWYFSIENAELLEYDEKLKEWVPVA